MFIIWIIAFALLGVLAAMAFALWITLVLLRFLFLAVLWAVAEFIDWRASRRVRA